MFDPEPDRDEAAQRPSPGWNVLATTLPLIDALDAVLDSLPGCAQGVHDWYAEFTGGPAAPDRELAWSSTRVRCGLCGQAAGLLLDGPPAGPAPDEPPVRRLVATAGLRRALADGHAGSTAQVQLGPIAASTLHLVLRHAWDTGGAGDAPRAASDAPSTTRIDRPMGLRTHFKRAAASCDGRATSLSGAAKPDEAALFTALADLFYEVSEQDEHTGPVAGRLLAVADLLVGYRGDDAPPQPPAPQGGDAQ